MTTTTVSFKDTLLAHFEEQLPVLPGNKELRKKAAKFFEEKGFPTRKTEDYKYIAPDTLFKKEPGFKTETVRNVTAADIKKLALLADAHVLVIVNGKFVPELSDISKLPESVIAHGIGYASVSDETALAHYARYATADMDPFAALNLALNEGGVFLHFKKNTVCDKPVHLIHITDNATETIFHPRNLIVVEENAEAVILESFETIGPVRSFTNALTEVSVATHAKLDHYRIQWEAATGQLMNTVQANIESESLYNTYTFTLGGGWVRNNLNVVMAGKKSEAHLFGLYLLNGSQVADNHTVVDHRVPDCMSNELYKGVMNGKSTAVFNGKIFVRQDAQKTNAFQTNRNILLSDDASVNTKPQLEIYADDVKCSHGTSTGKIDDEALFYLRSRGIGENNARKLLIRAFAEEVVNEVKLEGLKTLIEKRIDDILK
jgi:Fe-S cluster assembly protein SufD